MSGFVNDATLHTCHPASQWRRQPREPQACRASFAFVPARLRSWCHCLWHECFCFHPCDRNCHKTSEASTRSYSGGATTSHLPQGLSPASFSLPHLHESSVSIASTGQALGQRPPPRLLCRGQSSAKVDFGSSRQQTGWKPTTGERCTEWPLLHATASRTLTLRST